MMKNPNVLLLALLTFTARPAIAAGVCALPQQGMAGGAAISGTGYKADIGIGPLAGPSAAGAFTLGVGPQHASVAGYSCFLSTDAQFGVSALPGTRSVQRLVPSTNRTMLLEWTPSFGASAVTYAVNTGRSPIGLTTYTAGLAGTSLLLAALDYQAPYYWQIVVSDAF